MVTFSGQNEVKQIFDRLDRDLKTSHKRVINGFSEESRFFVQGRLDGDFPNPGGIRVLNTYFHTELDRDVEHKTVEHTKTGRLRDNIDIDLTDRGFEIVASAKDPDSGKDYAATVVQDDHEQGMMNYLEFGGWKLIKEMNNGGLDSIIKRSFWWAN